MEGSRRWKQRRVDGAEATKDEGEAAYLPIFQSSSLPIFSIRLLTSVNSMSLPNAGMPFSLARVLNCSLTKN